MTDSKNDERQWRIKKEVSLGDLIAFTMAALSVVYAYTTLDKRMTLIEKVVMEQKDIDRKQDEDHFRYQARIDVQLVEINRKLDRLIETRR